MFFFPRKCSHYQKRAAWTHCFFLFSLTISVMFKRFAIFTSYMQAMAVTFPFCNIVIGFNKNNNSNKRSCSAYTTAQKKWHTTQSTIYGTIVFFIMCLFICNANFNWNIEFCIRILCQRVYLDENDDSFTLSRTYDVRLVCRAHTFCSPLFECLPVRFFFRSA